MSESPEPMPTPFEGVDHFAALEDGRRQLMRAVARIEALEGLEDRAALEVHAGGWAVREVLAHLAAWDDLTTSFLRDVGGGQRSFALEARPDADWREWNAAQVAAHPEATLNEAVERLLGSRDALLGALYEFDAALLDLDVMPPWGIPDVMRGHLVAQAMHDAMHAEELLAALDGFGGEAS